MTADVRALILMPDVQARRQVALRLADAAVPSLEVASLTDLRAACGRAAASAPTREQCLIADIILPDGDGLSALALLRAIGPSPSALFRIAPGEAEFARPARLSGACVISSELGPELVADVARGMMARPLAQHEAPPEPPEPPSLPDWPLLSRRASERISPALLEAIGTLTPMQRSVFRLLGAGASNKVIADSLRIEDRTVEKHLQNIRQRLEVRDTRSLTALAGLVTFQRRARGAEPRSG